MHWGRAGSGTYVSQKSDSDKLLLVHFLTTRPHCSDTSGAYGAHPQLSGHRNTSAGWCRWKTVPITSLGKEVTCSLTSCPGAAGKPTVRIAGWRRLQRGTRARDQPRFVFQGRQLVPGAQVQMVWCSGTIGFESEVGDRFPREKGHFEARATDGHRCRVDTKNALAWFCLQTHYGSVKRTGRVTCPSHGQRSASQAAELLEGHYFASKGITSLFQRKECQL